MAIRSQAPLDKTFHALGDGTRRQIISILASHGAKTANELRAPFQVAQPTISKHLKVLEKAELVTRTVEGRFHRFSLNESRLREAEEWIAEHRAFWEGALDQLGSFLDESEHLENPT